MNTELKSGSLAGATAVARNRVVDERLLSISAVAIETGLSKETLRKWEDRYGFPQPERRAAGRRLYPLWQVAQLFEIKRRLDAGARPAEVVPDLWRKAGSPPEDVAPAPRAPRAPIVTEAVALLQDGDHEALRALLDREHAATGMRSFLIETVATLCRGVGEAWHDGDLRVHQEHLFSEVLGRMLDESTPRVSAGTGAPRVLLTTVPGELHTLGLRMVRALFADLGAYCIYLGPQIPLAEIPEAAALHRTSIVGLSFSHYFPRRQFVPVVQELRATLPPETALWLGGGGARRARRLGGGMRVFDSLHDAGVALETLRAGTAK
ncbi:MAG: MerR family DNA-binding transcriptional regulator [Gammaproteobacteria bacterium]|nr:MerR family DNA-binding transcriptional regulator [Gammaproteobacteria bacterium]MBI5618254.1 MerR family DNA-binding transcriptional regulator [Gammaproteobacteria bacterium]